MDDGREMLSLLIAEESELNRRIERLRVFLDGETAARLGRHHANLIAEQRGAMEEVARILSLRVGLLEARTGDD